MTDERIEQLWMSENGLEDCQLCVRADFQKAAKFFEAEVRKEQSKNIAELERQLAEARKDSERWGLIKSHWRTYKSSYRDDDGNTLKSAVITIKLDRQGTEALLIEQDFDAAIKAKEQPNG